MDGQLDLLNPKADFDGETYDPALDKDRLKKLHGRVYELLSDGRWHSSTEIRELGPSALERLRDLRKPKFGGHVIPPRRERGGLWWYRMVR